ncbi:hypothetical protein AHAS_Ahas12G0111400 [Arachis hypogaea]
MPPADSKRFANLYCELQFSLFQRRHLNLEKKLAIPSDLRVTLDAVHLRGRQIMVTEADIEEVLHCQPKVSDKDTFQRAEAETHSLTFDYDALRSVVAQLDGPWEMDASKVKPKGMRFDYLTKEAKIW